MYEKKIRRRRITLVAGVLLSIMLLTAYYGEPASGLLHSVQRGAMEVLAPLQKVSGRAVKPVSDVVGWTGDTLDAKSENDKMRDEIGDLRLRVARAETAERENRELRKLLGFEQSPAFPAGWRGVGARVIVHSPTAWYARVIIDRGSSSGVRVNQPVIAGDGLVGRITATSPHASQVMLITDPESGVSARVLRRDVRGIVRPRVGSSDLLVDFIHDRAGIRVGDIVVTAGSVVDAKLIASRFPPGVPVGAVTAVDVRERELYQRVRIKPYVDLRDLDLVVVLTRRGGG